MAFMSIPSLSTASEQDIPLYCILRWEVQNLLQARTVIMSPCFNVTNTSKWNLVLNPRIIVDEETFVEIRLQRNENYSSHSRVKIKGELTVHGPSTDLIFDQMFEKSYDSTPRDSIQFLINRSMFLNDVPTTDSHIIRCEMVVLLEATAFYEMRPFLQKLSLDLQIFYQNSKDTDVTIYTEDGYVFAHKSMLCARSSILAQTLDSFLDFIPSEKQSSDVITAVVLFLYTGNPELLISKYSLDIFGQIGTVAKTWHLPELADVFTPAKICCATRIQFDDFVYIWKISNFSKVESNRFKPIYSNEFKTKEDNATKWQLALDKRSGTNVDFYGLYLVKVTSNNEANRVELCFSVRNAKNGKVVSKEGVHTFKNSETWGYSTFVDKISLFDNLLDKDELTINCKLIIETKVESWSNFYETSVLYNDEDIQPMRYLTDLSCNLVELYDSQKYADVTLMAGTETLKAHRVILCARSPYFRNMVPFNSMEYIIVNTDADTMRMVLYYMYSAKIPDLNSQSAINVYMACALLEIGELRCVCQHYLVCNITVGNAIAVLTLASKYGDDMLMNTAMQFCCNPGNAKVIINTQKWKLFCREHNELAMNVYHELTTSYCNHVCN